MSSSSLSLLLVRDRGSEDPECEEEPGLYYSSNKERLLSEREEITTLPVIPVLDIYLSFSVSSCNVGSVLSPRYRCYNGVK